MFRSKTTIFAKFFFMYDVRSLTFTLFVLMDRVTPIATYRIFKFMIPYGNLRVTTDRAGSSPIDFINLR
jgi:hypothetical protein